jgi:hypothetical protein
MAGRDELSTQTIMNATAYAPTKNELSLSNAERKARLESELRQLVGRGWLDVRQAQQILAEDWTITNVSSSGHNESRSWSEIPSRRRDGSGGRPHSTAATG